MTFGPAGLPQTFTIDGDPFTLPDVGGGCVAGCASVGDWWGLVPDSLDGPSRDRLWLRLADPRDHLDLVWLHHVATVVLGEVCGVPWHAACRMSATAREHWLLFDSWCLSKGFDPQAAPAHRVVSAVYGWLRESCQDENEWGRLEMMIFDEPSLPRRAAGGAAPLWGSGEEARLFQQAMATLG